MITNGPRGTKDILPDNIGYWRYVEENARKVCSLYSYKEIRTPIFEHTELFLRGIGETTDIVEKEMYSFTDLGGRNITLRPENTAAAVRAYLDNKLYAGPQPTKLFYIGPMFRYDRPQAGRYRQFHQFGTEVLGASDAATDAEIISLAHQFLNELGLQELNLFINSVGCEKCRPTYRTKLRNYLESNLDKFCSDCKSRFDRNPMRILDCKNQSCAEHSKGAPDMISCLCEECTNHFEELKTLLTSAQIDYKINNRLVRGLDYYTKTAFEIQYPPLGAQSAVCGGGRYDGLVEECGGASTPGIGFAIGIERVLLALEKQNLLPNAKEELTVFVAPLGENAKAVAFKLLCELRKLHITADMDLLNRSLKAQLKHASKHNSQFVIIIGDDEVAKAEVVIKNMQTGLQEQIEMKKIVDYLAGIREE